MNRAFSIYLDLVRFSAAFLVYLWHSSQHYLTVTRLPCSSYGHSSVIVFFVLSGFVIAYVSDTKETTLPNFAASRVSRVFSVTIPTILITLILDAIGRIYYPEIYTYPYDHFLLRSISSLLLTNEFWLISITSFSNVPYWSICYEWWYYVTFALIAFLPRRFSLMMAAATLLAIGPKVILLAPVWWLGVLLYRWRALQSLSVALSWWLVVGSIAGIGLFHQSSIVDNVSAWLKGLVGNDLHRDLTFSKYFLTDYLLGLLVFINFAGMRRVAAHTARLFTLIERPVRFLASYTFSLYLLHQPVFLFWAALIRGNPNTLAYWFYVTILTMFSIGTIGYFTENRRHLLRGWLLLRFQRWGAQLSRRVAKAPGTPAESIATIVFPSDHKHEI